MHYQQQATQNTSSATNIAQSMDCCCAQLGNPPSTQTVKHLRLIPTCVITAMSDQESQQRMSCCREQ
eukprot:10874369-Ditylum_brightwellii.AAC.1